MSKNIPLIAQAIIDLNDMISNEVAFLINLQMNTVQKPCFGIAWVDDAICKDCEKYGDCETNFQVREIKAFSTTVSG